MHLLNTRTGIKIQGEKEGSVRENQMKEMNKKGLRLLAEGSGGREGNRQISLRGEFHIFGTMA